MSGAYLLLVPAAQHQYSHRYRQRAENGQGHPPVIEAQQQHDQPDGQDIAAQLGNQVGVGMLDFGAILHHIGGQFGEILAVKKAQGQLPQPFGDADAPVGGHGVGGHIGFVVFIAVGQEHHRCQHNYCCRPAP
ncbi:hypothetical protein D3C75_846950 [compost metagenome]